MRDFIFHQIISNIPNMAPKKEKKSSAKSVEPKREEEKTVRRTSRNIRARNDDDFVIGQQEIDRCIGRQPSEDEVGGKRTRKYNYYDECSDYEQNHRHPKKKPLTNNSVEGLLEWKEQQIIVSTPTDQNSKIIKVKNISKQQLDKHIQNIEALFINIDWGKKGQTINDFKNLKIDSFKLMEKGLIFIWAPKELIFQILKIMLEKDFFYVENLEIVHLNRQKAISLSKTCKGLKIQEQVSIPKLKSEKKKSKEQRITNFDHEENQHIDLKTIVSGLDNIDPNELILSNESQYFSSSKRTLLIFRRKSDQKIELRHQRTCDVVFDMPENPQAKCPLDTRKYIYKMIETMLPKCLENEGELKMLELWGDSDSRRRGWATMMEL